MSSSIKINYPNRLLKLIPDRDLEYIQAFDNWSYLLDRDAQKYAPITLNLFLLSFLNPFERLFNRIPQGFAPGIFTAYHFYRKIDDFADCDLKLPDEYESFEEMIDSLKLSIKKKDFDKRNTLEVLLRGTLRDMKNFRNVDISKGIMDFLDAMNFENYRRENKIISTRDELEKLYTNSFSSSQDITFIYLLSKTRAKNIPEFQQVLGRTYALRDLHQDISRGIIFIPKEDLPYDISVKELQRNYQILPEVKLWKEREISENYDLIQKLKKYDLDFFAKKIVNSLIDETQNYLLEEKRNFK